MEKPLPGRASPKPRSKTIAPPALPDGRAVNPFPERANGKAVAPPALPNGRAVNSFPERANSTAVDPPAHSTYHTKMAVKKESSKDKGKPKAPARIKSGARAIPWGTVFWVAFFAVVLCLFLFNRDTIRETLAETSRDEITFSGEQNPPAAENIFAENAESSGNNAADTPPAPVSVDQPMISSGYPAAEPAASDSGSGGAQNAQIPETTEPRQEGISDAGTLTDTPSASIPVLQERAMYFITVDRDGSILRTRVTRSLPVTDSPLTDTLSALLAGPLTEEQRRGLISLIPAETRIMNAMIRGNTAYINFSEDFQFNTYGVEGYAGALRQVIWTATEFSTVRDVQILIEGRRVDYLGEGVWIGSPVTREMF